jgi:mono/diheme cytochrome c family protein
MPSFKNVYKDKQIQNITYYISQAFNPNRDKKIQKLLASSEDFLDSKLSLSLGKKVWLKKCAKCHGSTGNARSEYIEISKVNDKFIYPYNLTRTLLNENQIFLYAKYGGKYWGADKSDMPAWEDKYNDFTLRSVAHYIKKNIVKIKN